MAKDFSFDVVNEIDTSKLLNAVDQAKKEVGTRYDLRGSNAEINLNDARTEIQIKANEQFQLDALLDIVRKKLSSNAIDQRVLITDTTPQHGVVWRWDVKIAAGIDQPTAKRIAKLLRDELPKAKICF